MSSIHPSVKLGQGVLIDEGVCIGEGCEIGHYAIITGDTIIGPYNKIGYHAVIGGEPQDHKYKGGGILRIGAHNQFREHTTVHVGHLEENGTVIGDHNVFFVGAHVAHDCKIGNHNLLANACLLAGHTRLGNYINMSGMVGTHQFCRVGSYAMISGGSGIRQDILPYALVQGDSAVHLGINAIGLSRNAFSDQDISAIGEAYRLFRKKDRAEEKEMDEKVKSFLAELDAFKNTSRRGIAKFGGSGKKGKL